MSSRAIKATPERVERMLSGERARLARLEAEIAETRERIANLERTADRLAGEERRGTFHAICGACGEGFVPADEDDLVHAEHEDGSPCGGLGEIVGEWW